MYRKHAGGYGVIEFHRFVCILLYTTFIFSYTASTRKPRRKLLRRITVYAVYTWIGTEIGISAVNYVFEKSFSRILENHIDSFKVIRSDGPFCTQSFL
jgi:hypothetical protein